MTISGGSDCKWKEKNDNGKTESFKAQESYLQNVAFIFGSEDADPTEIGPGFHTFSFSNALPSNIPSSYDSKHGKVSYKVEAVFIIPWKLINLKAKADVKVITQIDLNLDPSLKMPYYSEFSKRLRHWFILSKELQIKVGIPYSGYIPGHQVKIIFDVNNRSNVNVNKMTIELVQVIKLTSQKPSERTKTERKVILEAFALGTNKRSINQFESDIMIPANLVPVKHSNVISLSYEIEITVNISSFVHKNPKFVIPIEIGTVPLTFDRFSRCPSDMSNRTSFIRK